MGSAGMVTLPSPSETASRTAPVASFEMVTFAPRTTASFWSTTTTIIEAVFGDCATAACARSSAVRSSVKKGAVRRATVLELHMVVLPAVIYRKVFWQKSSPGGGGRLMIRPAAELLPAVVLRARSDFSSFLSFHV